MSAANSAAANTTCHPEHLVDRDAMPAMRAMIALQVIALPSQPRTAS